MKKTILKSFIAAVTGVLFITCLSSCSKKDDDDSSPESGGRTAKFTVTVTGAPESAYVSFVVVGLTNNPSESTVWKVNGVEKNNESAVSLGQNNFKGDTKTYVIESIKPLTAISVGVQCLSPANLPYKISYKAEINGKVKEDVKDFTVTKDADFTHDYTY